MDPNKLAWESYFYPESYNQVTGQGVFRNEFGIRDADNLRDVEYEFADYRFQQLRNGEVRIPLSPDVSYLQDVHRHLFQDIYPWAGELRRVNMGKLDPVTGRAESMFTKEQEIRQTVRPLMQKIVTVDWQHLDRDAFVTVSAASFTGINYAHPFREGNGRMTKAVLHELSDLSGFGFDFDSVTPGEWNAMAKATMPSQVSGLRVEPAVELFQDIVFTRKTPAPEHGARDSKSVAEQIFKNKGNDKDVSRGLKAGISEDASKKYGKGYGQSR